MESKDTLFLTDKTDWIERFNQLDINYSIGKEAKPEDMVTEHIIIDSSIVSASEFKKPPQTSVVTVLMEREDFNEARAWMNVGADAIYIFPKEIDRLHVWLEKMEERILNKRDLLGDDEGNEVWAFYSAKGGSGRSTIAAITAQSLAIHQDKKVLLLDMNSQFGGLESLFGLEGGRSYQQLEVVLDELTSEHIINVSYPTDSGVHVLLGPGNPIKAAELTEALLPRIIKVARTHFDHVILDLPPELSDKSYAGLSEATKLFYVLSPDSLAIRAFKQSRGIFERFTLNNKKTFSIILNNHGPKNELQQKDVEKIIDESIFATISNDFKGIQPIINMGLPFFEKKKDRGSTKVSRDVRKMVHKVSEEE
ncbi:AAA family ATPase [Virgibacillus doumboii]|uniref:AAA family ATPase n=1 Tax=Virgibacillus doumboii TaxID=2697503 RepID=UPI0013DEF9D0|nr:AAA family ATPase [Virgibacillus doumboii]